MAIMTPPSALRAPSLRLPAPLSSTTRFLHTSPTLVARKPVSARCSGPLRPTKRSFSSSPSTHPTTHRVGAHISASGGCLRALDNAQQLLGSNARAFAFFIRPRLSWRPVAPIGAADAALFRRRLATHSHFHADSVVVHGSYILNFGSHDDALRCKSVELMVEEVAKCAQLGIRSYVFHPGSCTRVPAHLQWPVLPKGKSSKIRISDDQRLEASAMETQARALSAEYIGECMAQVLRQTPQEVTLCAENMCGQGNVLGSNFGELRSILDHTVAYSSSSADDSRRRLGVCLDTCHAHASGLAMQTPDECELMMQSFDDAMGAAWLQCSVLKVVHVNDSMDACGARRDRHENLGLGQIGLSAFEWLMNSPRFVGLPMILETPRRGVEALRERVERVENAVHRELLQNSLIEDSDANEIDLLLKLVRH